MLHYLHLNQKMDKLSLEYVWTSSNALRSKDTFAYKISKVAVQRECGGGELGMEYRHHLHQVQAHNRIPDCDYQLLQLAHTSPVSAEICTASYSIEGENRSLDNVYIERFWRALKYKDFYIKSFKGMKVSKAELTAFTGRYNDHRRHPSLDNYTHSKVYFNHVILKVAA